MLENDIKQAREAAGLSVSDVAKMANVPRQQVYALEQGANVTLDTLRRIGAVIPNLGRVTLGKMEILMANEDLEEARQAALDLFDASKRLMAALGAVPSTPAPRTARRLEQRVRQGKRKRRTDA